MSDTYKGWKNYQTWNVTLWILNDEGLYQIARRYKRKGYLAFVKEMKDMGSESVADGRASLIYYQTPDGVAWNDSGLDVSALDEMFSEL